MSRAPRKAILLSKNILVYNSPTQELIPDRAAPLWHLYFHSIFVGCSSIVLIVCLLFFFFFFSTNLLRSCKWCLIPTRWPIMFRALGKSLSKTAFLMELTMRLKVCDLGGVRRTFASAIPKKIQRQITHWNVGRRANQDETGFLIIIIRLLYAAWNEGKF